MRNLILISLTFLVIGCAPSQNLVRTYEVKEEGYERKVTFVPVKDDCMINDVVVNIKPLEPNHLDSLFVSEAKLNGKLNWTYYNQSKDHYILKPKQSSSIKTDDDYMIMGINRLLSLDLISKKEADKLLSNMSNTNKINSQTSLSNINNSNAFNPFNDNIKYYSVFEFTFNNASNEAKEIIFNPQFLSNEKLQQPLSSSSIIELQGSAINNYKVEALHRYNIDEKIIIPAQSQVKKYISTLPIDYDEHLNIYWGEEKLEWNIVEDKKSFENIDTYYIFTLTYLIRQQHASSLNTISIISGISDAYVNGDEVYINKSALEQELEIITVKTYKNKVHFLREKVKGSNYLKGNYRENISLNLQKVG